MKNTICDEDQAMIQSFIEQTRELSKCARCINLLHDPVKAKCGHLFCRTCIFEKVNNHTNSLHIQSYCDFCKITVPNSVIEEVSLKISTLSSCLQQFVNDFCSERDFTVVSSIGRKTNVEAEPLILFEENGHTQEANPAVSETCSGSIQISGPSTPPLTSHSTVQPIQKVGQWLMSNSNEDPLTTHEEEDCGNGINVENSGTLSFQSLKVSPSSLITSSNDKELSYDIVSAPSPPPPREDIDPQVKQGKPRRGRGRPRKNALPISSGETFAKMRELSYSTAPEIKLPGVTTPISRLSFSQDIGEVVASKTTAKSVTTQAHSSMFPLAKSNRLDQCEGSIQNEINMREGEAKRVLVDTGVSLTNEILQIPADNLVRQWGKGEHVLNHQDVPCATANAEVTQSLEPNPPNRLNLHLLPLMSTSSPQPEKYDWAPQTAHHLTPVSRPKMQNATISTKSNHQTSAQKLRSHLPFPALNGERRTVSFFHKGRITPRISVNSFKRQPIVFTRLGRLGPILDMATSDLPFPGDSVLDAHKFISAKPTQTSSSHITSLASVATQTETTEVTSILTTEVQSRIDSRSQSQVYILPHNTVPMCGPPLSPGKQAGNEGNDGITNKKQSDDECSEDMFTEPFKRARVLSSSDSENEMAEPKRRKPSSLVVVNPIPVSSMAPFVNSNIILAKELLQQPAELNVEEAAACKTVVMESDADSDESEFLTPTPPRPPPPNSIACKPRVFTCSGIPRPQVKMIEDWAQKIGAEILLTYNSSVTHVIVCLDEENCAQRTLKFLYGVASGNWIIGVDWVHQCIREDRLIDEEPFEALDMDGEDGPRRARQACQREKLFEAFEFCCQGPFTDVTVDQLNQLLQLCGAETVPSPSHLTKRRRYTMIVVQTEDDVNLEVRRKAIKWFDCLKVVTVSREWVLDCLAAYQLLPVRNQLIGKYSVSVLKMMGFDARLVV